MKSILILTLLLASVQCLPQQWEMIPDLSELRFSFQYQGKTYNGHFDRFDLNLSFDEQDLESFDLQVNVDPKSVNTSDQERDGFLQGREWFASRSYPRASYRSSGAAVQSNSKYISKGQLSIKSITRPVPIYFEWHKQDDIVQGEHKVKLVGSSKLDRMFFNVGIGEWSDSALVDHTVKINFTIHLIRKIKQSKLK